MKEFYVYIMTNPGRTTLYIGFTNGLEGRVCAHKQKKFPGFSAKYNTIHLVYFEVFKYVNDALRREKQLKKWKRAWKEELINELNPEWEDLSKEW